ncbi:MAG TPA: type II toxin-antitoxin system VapC family toxin [Xanthobacteraceae bacterium]|nr:type II toxin-antitoxin system VapC family toxin [Xanthobacteraceae bacterium]
MSRSVLDSSAILALFEKEQGWEKVRAALPDGIVSSLTLAEVVTRLTLRGGKPWQVAAAWDDLRLFVETFDDARARVAGLLVDKTRSLGLSLADRACLALARELGLPVVTADRSWRGVQIGVEVVLIR